jgi:hypothetical protein
MAMPTIVASNQTGGTILLTRLGLTVPSAGTLTLTDFATVREIREDESLESSIGLGNMLLNYGEGDLTQGDSLKFFDVQTLESRISVRGMSTTNIASLSGTTTVDTTVVLAVDDRVLLQGQSTATENGIWVVQAGAWVRPQDFEIGRSAAAAKVFIQEGTTHAGEMWACTSLTGSDVIGTNNLSFAQISGTGGGGVTNLQEAYEGGNTIGATAAEGNIAFTLTSADFTVDGANDMLFGGTTPLAIFNVDTVAMSLDSTDTTNLTMTANVAADRTLTIAASNSNGGGDGLIAMTADGEIDIDSVGALSLNSSGAAINVGDDADTGAINIGTGAAARTIKVGNATSTTQLDMDSGTGGTLIDSTGIISLDGVGASNFTTDTGNLTLATTTSGAINLSSVGAIDAQAAGNVTIDSSGGTIGMGTDANTGAINIGTGAAARTITIGNTTGATALNLSSGTGNTLITSPQVTMTGNLVVQGTTTTVESEIVNVADNFLWLNDGYTTTSALEGGIVINSLPTATNDTVAAGGFTASGGGQNAEVATTAAAAFAVGDFIQISGANNQSNDGLYEVLTSAANVLTIAGIGGEGAATFQFTQNDFVTDSTVAGTITKVTVGAIQVSTTGKLQYGYDSDNGMTFGNVVTTPGTGTDLTLQNAYVGGNTITTSAGEGVVTIAGDQELNITATGGLNLDTQLDFDGTVFDVQMTGNNGFSLDGTADSNVTATNTAASTNLTLTLGAVNTGATAGDALVDINATSTNGTGTIEMDADDAIGLNVLSGGTIDIGSDAAAATVTVGNNTGATGVTIDSGTEMVEIDGVTYYGANAGLPSATGSGFQDGDKFYDTDLDMEMRYDSTRGKWLSVEAFYIPFGRQGNQGTGVYFRGAANQVMSSTNGYVAPYNGTIVGLGYTRDDSDAATFDVVEGGTSRATLASAATAGKSNALDGNFSADGVLAVVNQAGGNTMTDVIAWVKVKFRSV